MTLLLTALAAFLLVMWHRAINSRPPKNKVAARLRRALTPLAIIAAVLILHRFVTYQVNIAGTFAQAAYFAYTLVIHLATVWIFWLIVLAEGDAKRQPKPDGK